MSIRIGFAMIPDQKTIEAIVSAENTLSKNYTFASDLGTVYNLPHITIFQNTFSDKVPYITLLNKVAVEFTRLGINGVHLTDIIYEPGGWYFQLAQKTHALQELHEYALYHAKDYIADRPETVDQTLPFWQREGLLNYGYRYAGEAYMPHITLSRTHARDKDQRIITAFSDVLSGIPKDIGIQKIVVHEVGENGEYANVLSEIVLLGCKQSEFTH